MPMRDISEKKVIFCRFLSLGDDVECNARDAEPYRPSEFQQKGYCIAGNYQSCPFYSFAMSNGAVVAHSLFRGEGNGR